MKKLCLIMKAREETRISAPEMNCMNGKIYLDGP
jgi:hypothetical protein